MKILIVAISFVTVLCFGIYWRIGTNKRIHDPKYNITAIIQTGPEKEALKSAYLVELLELSLDQPTNLYAFDLEKGEKKLLSSPLIAEAKIKRESPNILYIDYTVRKPIARLGDYQNIAIDKDGYLFPITPFFAPKELPEMILGLPAFGRDADSYGRKGGAWHVPLQNKHFSLALEILSYFEKSGSRDFRLKRIDVSNAYAPSLGRREIVLLTEEELMQGSNYCIFPKMLRLATKDYAQQINHFFSLRKKMIEDYSRQLGDVVIPSSGKFSSRIVDLRIPHLAFVEN